MTNIIELPVVTTLNVDPDRVLKKAQEENLAGVVILGWTEDDEEYFASSIASGPEVVWLLARLQSKLTAPSEEDE